MNPPLQDIATAALAQKFYAHRAHHLAKGPVGPQNHKFFGELYPEYDRLFDTLVEFAIACGQDPDHVAMHENASASLRHHSDDRSTNQFFGTLIWMEDAFSRQIDLLLTQKCDNALQGLLQQIATDSRQRRFILGTHVPKP